MLVDNRDWQDCSDIPDPEGNWGSGFPDSPALSGCWNSGYPGPEEPDEWAPEKLEDPGSLDSIALGWRVESWTPSLSGLDLFACRALNLNSKGTSILITFSLSKRTGNNLLSLISATKLKLDSIALFFHVFNISF